MVDNSLHPMRLLRAFRQQKLKKIIEVERPSNPSQAKVISYDLILVSIFSNYQDCSAKSHRIELEFDTIADVELVSLCKPKVVQKLNA